MKKRLFIIISILLFVLGALWGMDNNNNRFELISSVWIIAGIIGIAAGISLLK